MSNQEILKETVSKMMQKGKGILAADESNGTADKRLSTIGVEGNEENRRRYRDLLLSADSIGNYLSGVILFDETIRQEALDGKLFITKLINNGIIPGIKVDTGAKDSIDFPGEKVTEGLDGLETRLKEYFDMGARFAKWRAVITISESLPTDGAIKVNAEILAKYSKMCQEAGIVPMVEPEVLLDGSHTMERAYEVTARAVKKVIDALKKEDVWLPGVILKTSMVLPGNKSGESKTPGEVAEATVRYLRESVPEELGGVVFLSGGQSPLEATENLDAIAKLEPLPWEIAFSYARAIQGPVLEAWKGKDENVEVARTVYIERLKELVKADHGKFR